MGTKIHRKALMLVLILGFIATLGLIAVAGYIEALFLVTLGWLVLPVIVIYVWRRIKTKR